MINKIIPAITPSNIKEIQLLKDSMDIFLEYLTEHSDIAIDIKNILDQDKEPIYEEFIKIYLNGIYSVLSKSEHNEKLYDKLKTSYRAAGLNIEDIDLSVDIVKLLEEEYILTNKHYKQAKGTPTAMEYIFNIIINSGVQNDFLGDNIGRFRYFEGENIFEYTIEGTMIEEVYNHFVKPLVHPVGWAYFYQRVFYQSFTDYFNIKFDYTFAENGLEVRCMNGDILSKDDYKNNISHTGGQLVEDNNVVFINVDYLGSADNATKRTSVYFVSGEYLVSNDKPRSLKLYKNNVVEIDYDEFDGNCGLYLDYTTKISSVVDDDIGFEDISQISSTTGKKNIIGAGNVYVGATICGEDLVNKDVSVTYKSYTGVHDGADYTRTFAAGGIDEFTSLPDYYWDNNHLRYDEFDYDTYVEGTRILHNLSGKTASDEYNWHQELKYCGENTDEPQLPDGRENHRCDIVFEDTLQYSVYWDTHNMVFDDFNYDGEYVVEEFSINYDRNVWDTNLYFDFFNYDSEYTTGGTY
jgi:hypothetical protein